MCDVSGTLCSQLHTTTDAPSYACCCTSLSPQEKCLRALRKRLISGRYPCLYGHCLSGHCLSGLRAVSTVLWASVPGAVPCVRFVHGRFLNFHASAHAHVVQGRMLVFPMSAHVRARRARIDPAVPHVCLCACVSCREGFCSSPRRKSVRLRGLRAE